VSELTDIQTSSGPKFVSRMVGISCTSVASFVDSILLVNLRECQLLKSFEVS
jgi:hypothetical protein